MLICNRVCVPVQTRFPSFQNDSRSDHGCWPDGVEWSNGQINHPTAEPDGLGRAEMGLEAVLTRFEGVYPPLSGPEV